MRKLHFNTKAALLTLLLLLALPHQGQAQTIVVDNNMTFGHLSIRDNSANRDIVLLPTGSYVADPEYIFYSDEPALGQITISGQPPSALMDVTIDLVTPINISGGGCCTASFSLINPFTVPAVVVTSPAGTATFQVGGTLRSDGTGTPFLDATYLGIFSVSVAPN
jgi:hypothetical protein